MPHHPDKFNCELLGVGNCVHMHWCIFPRHLRDMPTPGLVWKFAKKELNSDEYRPDKEELKNLKALLNAELDKLIH